MGPGGAPTLRGARALPCAGAGAASLVTEDVAALEEHVDGLCEGSAFVDAACSAVGFACRGDRWHVGNRHVGRPYTTVRLFRGVLWSECG